MQKLLKTKTAWLSLISIISLVKVSFAAESLQMIEKIKNQALSDDYAYHQIEAITTEIGARPLGSAKELNALKWLEQQLTELSVGHLSKQPLKVRNWQRISASAQVISPYKHELVIESLGGSVATPAEGLEAEVIKINNFDHLNSVEADKLKDKIVYISRKLDEHSPAEDYLNMQRIRQKGAIIAANKGAKALIIRSQTTDKSRTAHTGAVRYHSNSPQIPAAAISPADADLLDRLFARNLPVALLINLQNSESRWVDTYNLIATLSADHSQNNPNKVVFIAHIDSWDLGTGALDNAAGIGIGLGIIKQLIQFQDKLKHDIEIVFVTAAQFNQLGIKTYIKHLNDKHIVVATEADLGGESIFRLDTNIDESALKLADKIHTLTTDLAIERGHNASGGATNTQHMLALDIPIFNWVQKTDNYFKYLHSANDTFDKISLESIQQNVATYSIFLFSVANEGLIFSNKVTEHEQPTETTVTQ
ncbi:peptidase M28 [Catenovulum agarivorans DS-2]|uniref:Carboxypeptidase Q n=1 Tax=Catenovulum agarivorans DS-2 TaxID=1328313 RepID=W7QLJ4_9ALTE|nr:M28 family peptidase [Catenovulum agarivorans]EWH08998.1 peptidase M28 [Catenovulum agarivorans DS-2]